MRPVVQGGRLTETRCNMRSRRVQSAVLCSVLLLAACKGGSQPSTTPIIPSAPSLVPSPPTSNVANWRADATVLSATTPGRACGWGTSAGEVRTGVDWRITITGGSILLDEDMRNWPTDHIPFSGTLSGRQFTATYTSGGQLPAVRLPVQGRNAHRHFLR